MNSEEFYYIIAFDTTTAAMQAEKFARDGFSAVIMPVPREISGGCGLALRLCESSEEKALDFCRACPVNGTLYRFGTSRKNGRHPTEKLLSF